MKHLSLATLAVGALLCAASGAQAQFGGGTQLGGGSPFGGRPFSNPGAPGGGGFSNGGNQNASNQGRNNNNGAVLQLPQDVERLVAVNAYNTIIIQNKANTLKPLYQTYKTQHIPASGIARLFGGTVITTEELLGLDQVGGFGNNGGFGGGFSNSGNFGGGFGQNGFGQNGLGQNGSGNGFNNGFNGGGGGIGGGGVGAGVIGGGFNNGNIF